MYNGTDFSEQRVQWAGHKEPIGEVGPGKNITRDGRILYKRETISQWAFKRFPQGTTVHFLMKDCSILL